MLGFQTNLLKAKHAWIEIIHIFNPSLSNALHLWQTGWRQHEPDSESPLIKYVLFIWLSYLRIPNFLKTVSLFSPMICCTSSALCHGSDGTRLSCPYCLLSRAVQSSASFCSQDSEVCGDPGFPVVKIPLSASLVQPKRMLSSAFDTSSAAGAVGTMARLTSDRLRRSTEEFLWFTPLNKITCLPRITSVISHVLFTNRCWLYWIMLYKIKATFRGGGTRLGYIHTGSAYFFSLMNVMVWSQRFPYYAYIPLIVVLASKMVRGIF